MTKENNLGEQIEFVRLDWRLTGKGELPCKVSNDMFETIKVVEITIKDQVFIFFEVANDFVETDEPIVPGKEVNGWVKVKVKTERDGQIVVFMPGEPLGNYGDIIEVPKEIIRGIKVPKTLIHPA